MKDIDIIALEGVIRESLQIITTSFSYLSYFLSALFVVFITILSWFIINVIKYKN
tara:strand:+ start:1217 stop:1381 length:165 start_codon:yes stop_codon:yes gene_type:complete